MAAAVGVAEAATTAVRAARAATAAGWPGLELLARGGEDCLTLGLKLCPQCVLTMARLEKERRWRGRKVLEMNWNEKESKRGRWGWLGLNR